MKRHGFSGMPASHGASLSHRSIGSTGQRDAPGRVCYKLTSPRTEQFVYMSPLKRDMVAIRTRSIGLLLEVMHPLGMTILGCCIYLPVYF